MIDEVLNFYRQYEGEAGRKLLVKAVQQQTGIESRDLSDARRRVEQDRQKIESTIANLLDNITRANRDLADQRLAELRREREELQMRASELERLAAQHEHVDAIVHEASKFLSSLEFTLRHGMPEERKTTLRQCIGAMDHQSRSPFHCCGTACDSRFDSIQFAPIAGAIIRMQGQVADCLLGGQVNRRKHAADSA
ncbi:MAG: hypothetical protein L0219_12720 [Phycisphaerales bacterium]|nr:hypothetical protein [Phycisphaerales bacterium]